ncbi:MAG: hypothetical protein HOO96_20090 [Polyangiaceae bacterium]|nr:hypothetical protein [Polyangiaceae bacterium]
MTQDHNSALAAAAKAVLGPIGCVRKGKSRTWVADHGWWAGLIEFQPSSWSKGTYLNVGAAWLWHEQDYWSFDDGAGQSGPRVAGFQEARSGGDFRDKARGLAEIAKRELLALRARHCSLEATAKYLASRHDEGIWADYHCGVAAGLTGQRAVAEERFAAVLVAAPVAPWMEELQVRTRELVGLLGSADMFRAAVEGIILRTRGLRKLPALADIWATHARESPEE